MPRVLGTGGVFIKSKNPDALRGATALTAKGAQVLDRREEGEQGDGTLLELWQPAAT